MIDTLGSHAGGGDPPEFPVEKPDRPTGGSMVAAAKAFHQTGYGIRLQTGRGRHFGTKSNSRKTSKAAIQSAGLLSHYRVKGDTT
jgi:hypothetical protein